MTPLPPMACPFLTSPLYPPSTLSLPPSCDQLQAECTVNSPPKSSCPLLGPQGGLNKVQAPRPGAPHHLPSSDTSRSISPLPPSSAPVYLSWSQPSRLLCPARPFPFTALAQEIGSSCTFLVHGGYSARASLLGHTAVLIQRQEPKPLLQQPWDLWMPTDWPTLSPQVLLSPTVPHGLSMSLLGLLHRVKPQAPLSAVQAATGREPGLPMAPVSPTLPLRPVCCAGHTTSVLRSAQKSQVVLVSCGLALGHQKGSTRCGNSLTGRHAERAAQPSLSSCDKC